jgi:threonine dehydrogenase-like Zn-dependent dehydrogenase
MSGVTLEEYRSAEQPIPDRMLRWHLYGAGLDSLGKEGQPETVEVPEMGPHELLVRQDACGLCFSDTKVIALGANHPRMSGRDLARDPVTLGHEVAVTVVRVGDELKERFQVGQRFVVQADVFYQGKSMAYGYAIRGGLAEYSIIPRAVIEGDEGCYLLPIRPDTGYVESALTEPWACVVSAYAQSHREGIKPGGLLLVVGSDTATRTEYTWSNLLTVAHKPRQILTYGVGGLAQKGLAAAAAQLGVEVVNEFAEGPEVGRMPADAYSKVDDILFLGNVAPEEIEDIVKVIDDHGIVNFVTDSELPRSLSLDIGRIHYNWHYYLGTTTTDPSNAYRETRTADLVAGGMTWFIGAGGPMGQMHVQRAVQHPNPPKLIVATDVDAVRLASVSERFGVMAEQRGLTLVTLNPNELGAETFDSELARLTGGRGFDDIVCMVPLASLIEHSEKHVAEGGWVNIFAGVARGTMATLDVNAIIRRRVRFLGSSGSSLADMRETLRRVEQDELSTNASLAAIGGMSAAAEGLKAVKEGWFAGKTLIFPWIHDLPLTPLAELKERFPTVYAKLLDGKFWTNEAEQELMRIMLTEAP